jgi:hypothetical protein
MARSIATLVTDPSSFFASREASPGRLGPVVVVALTGAMTLFAQLLLVSMTVVGSQPTIEYVTHAVRVQLPAVSVVGAAISFGHVFGYWLAYALVFVLVTRLFGAAENPRSTMVLAGWGFFPWALSGAVWLLAMIASAGTTPAPEMASGNAAFVQAVQATPLVEATRLLDHVAVVWSLGLWTVLLRTVRGVGYPQAAVAVLPVALFELLKVHVLF